jgi:exoribonuclease-2
MASTGDIVVYKGRPAVVSAIDDKIEIKTAAGSSVRVRDKDIEPLFSFGTKQRALTDPSALEAASRELDSDTALELGELLEGEASTLKSFAELAWSEWNPRNAWAAWKALRQGGFLTGTPEVLYVKPRAEIEALAAERQAKEADAAGRDEFIQRLKAKKLDLAEDSSDRRYMQDVEALALGQSAKSRTMKAAGLAETPERAHQLLLETGLWDDFVNPWPQREGCTVAPPPTPEPNVRTLVTERSVLFPELTSQASIRWP